MHGYQHRCTLIFHQEHHEFCRLRFARVPTDDVNIISAFIEALTRRQSYFLSAWWIATFPGFAIFAIVIGFNLLGDALRDQFDPRRRLLFSR